MRIEAILSMRSVRVGIGVVLLVSALALYIYAAIYYDTENILDDSVSWFHKHIFDLMVKHGAINVDHHLRFIDGRDLSRSFVLIDQLLSGIGLSASTLLFGLIYMILVAVASYLFFKDPVSAGFSLILFATTPAFLYWFKHNIYGAYIVQALWLLPVITIWYGIKRNSYPLAVLGGLLITVLWFLWPGSWFLILLFSIYLGALIYTGRVEALDLAVAFTVAVTTLPLNIILGWYPIVAYHVLTYILLLSYSIIGLVEYYSMKRVGRVERNAWRIIGVLAGIGIALGAMGLVSPLAGSLGYYEDYYKSYNPFLDYGVLSILVIFAVMLILRSGLVRDIRGRFLSFIIVLASIMGVIVGYLDPTISVVAASGLAVLASYGLIRILVFTYRNSVGLTRLIYVVIVLWIITGSIAANMVPGLSYASHTPSIYYADLPTQLANRTLTYSPFIQALSAISENTSGSRALVISYWGFSYWIVGYLGRDSYTLADTVGSPHGWKIISWIFTSDEDTALGFIKQILGNYTGVNVYILVTGVFSVEETTGIIGGANAHLGYPIVLPPNTPGGQPQVFYRPIGDFERIPLYIVTAGKNPNNYIDFPKTQYSFQAGLAWKPQLSNSVIAELLVYAVKKLNYTVINDVVSPVPMTVKTPKYFQLVNVTSIPIRMVDTGTSRLLVEYFTAAYKVKI